MNSVLSNLLAFWISSVLQVIGIPTLCQLLALFGRAFGPDGCLHWSELPVSQQEQILNEFPDLKKPHDDWTRWLRWVPRTLTLYRLPDGPPPVLPGSTSYSEFIDIPARGTFVATRGYIAYRLVNGFHVRFGFRWDYSVRMLVLSAAAKMVSGD